jgi:ATP-dependent RNA helicase DbpA
MPSINLSLSDPVLKRLEELGFTEPTPIQSIAIPELIACNNAIIRAETGSGKTAAYALPFISAITEPASEIRCLMLVPTRELAIQVHAEVKNFAFHIANLKISTAYGGHGFDVERKSLKHPPAVLIATPGRLADHLRRNTLDLNKVEYFVIDEADKLLEMGFEEELNFILKYLPVKRQTVMISATFSPKLDDLANKIFKGKPLRLEAGTNAVPSQIEHFVIPSDNSQKDDLLVQLVQKNPNASAIIFCNTREKCTQLAQALSAARLSPGILNGSLEQIERDKVMAQFRNGSLKVLVATDLAARGIDISSLDIVINYEIPDQESALLHRIGRTARAGHKGIVYSLASAREMSKIESWTSDFKIVAPKMIFSAEKAAAGSAAINMTTLHLHAGKKEKISKGDIVGALTGDAGLDSKDIGLIELFDHFSYVAVPEAKSKKILEKLNGGKIKGRKIKVSLVG